MFLIPSSYRCSTGGAVAAGGGVGRPIGSASPPTFARHSVKRTNASSTTATNQITRNLLRNIPTHQHHSPAPATAATATTRELRPARPILEMPRAGVAQR